MPRRRARQQGERDAASAQWLAPLWKHQTQLAISSGPREGAKVWSGQLPTQQLIGLMDPGLAEDGILELLDGASDDGAALALGFLGALSRPWSVNLSEKALSLVRARLQTRADQGAYRWATALAEMARVVPDLFQTEGSFGAGVRVAAAPSEKPPESVLDLPAAATTPPFEAA